MESANNSAHGSPAYEIWGDSKWAEFYIYDLYTALGMGREAKGACRRFTGNTDDFPGPFSFLACVVPRGPCRFTG